MLLMLAATLALTDSARTYYLHVAAAESVQVTDWGQGAPVVLVPGLFGSAYGFRNVTPLLVREGYRAIVIEPLGIGSSGRGGRADYSLTAQAARIAAVLDSLGVENALIVAHSVAATMAYRLAYRRPDLVAGILSIEGGAAESATTRSFQRAMLFAPLIKWLGGMWLIRKTIRSGLRDASGDTSWVTDEVIQGYTAGAAADLDGTLKAFLRMAEAREPEMLGPRLREIYCPVRLMVGGAPHEGGPTQPQVEAMRAALASFMVDTVPGAGHFIHEEQPAAVVASVQQLMANSLPRSARRN